MPLQSMPCWLGSFAGLSCCLRLQLKAQLPHMMQADEELLLLEAIDMSGLGNWAAVAEHVGTKSKEACKVRLWVLFHNC